MKPQTGGRARPLVIGVGEVLWDLLPGAQQGATPPVPEHLRAEMKEAW
jgi:hypothetical protein